MSCDNGHPWVVFLGDNCPVCKLIDELRDVRTEIDELKTEVECEREQLIDLKNEIVRPCLS